MATPRTVLLAAHDVRRAASRIAHDAVERDRGRARPPGGGGRARRGRARGEGGGGRMKPPERPTPTPTRVEGARPLRWQRRHVLDTDDWSGAEIEAVLETTGAMIGILQRPV